MTDEERLKRALERSKNGYPKTTPVNTRKVAHEFFKDFTKDDYIKFNKMLEDEVKQLCKERFPSLPRRIFNKLKNIFTGGH